MLTVFTTDHNSIVNINTIIACVSTIPEFTINFDQCQRSLPPTYETGALVMKISKVGPILVVAITIDTITYNFAPAERIQSLQLIVRNLDDISRL